MGSRDHRVGFLALVVPHVNIGPSLDEEGSDIHFLLARQQCQWCHLRLVQNIDGNARLGEAQ